jgi:anti-anti-sigma factor
MSQPTEETQMTAEQGPIEVVVAVTDAFAGPCVERWGSLITEAVELRPGRLIVDLSQSPSIDASAIVLLLQVHRRLVCADGQLTLRGPVPRVRRMLGLARVDHVLDVQPVDRGAAIPDDGALADAR